SRRSSRDLHFARSRSRLSSNGAMARKLLPAAGINGESMALVVEGLTKRFGATAALNGISLQVPKGGFLALLGPSASGKTTLLRILGGLEHAEAGRVTYDGGDWLSVPTRERRAGFVFQQYALFRHMTVADNIAFGLRVRRRSERPSRADIAA